jgi:hypothetical protein
MPYHKYKPYAYYNRDLKLIGKHNKNTWSPLNKDDIERVEFTKTLQLTHTNKHPTHQTRR